MICPYCNKEAKWCDNKEVYGRRYGKSYMCYWCKDCETYVGCHQNTKSPLGTMANKELREWRIKAHDVIDKLWKSGEMKRRDVYRELDKKFGFKVHIGNADKELCLKIIKSYKIKI